MVAFGPARLEGDRLVGLPASGVITSRFGARDVSTHSGVDIAMPTGTAVRAPAPGVVAFTSGPVNPGWWSPVWGASVVLRHDDGSHSLYAHLHSTTVVEGAAVARGALLGWSGSSGRSTGPHLHWGHAAPGNAWIRRAKGLFDPLASITSSVEPSAWQVSIEAAEAALDAIAAVVEAERQRLHPLG